MADAVLSVARAALRGRGPVAGVGIANQRASSIVWERATGRPVAPGIGWQDLRTVGTCLVLQAEGIRLAPNASATKVMAILDEVDPERTRAERGELCFGTVDSWVAWTLSGGAEAGSDALHVTDATNAAVTALVEPATIGWDEPLLQQAADPVADDAGGSSTRPGPSAPRPRSRAPRPSAASPVTSRPPSSARAARCPAWPRRPSGPAGCSTSAPGPGHGPAFAGRGAARDLPDRRLPGRPGTRPGAPKRSCCRPAPPSNGCGTTSGSSRRRTSPRRWPRSARPSGDVWFVPALLGLGTPVWDFGARGTLVGLTRGSGRPEIVRAVLEGVAHRGADLVEASERDSGYPIAALRIDGGMSDNDVFVEALGRRHRAARRGLTGPGGNHARRRTPGRAGRRQLRVDRGAREHLLAPANRRAYG